MAHRAVRILNLTYVRVLCVLVRRFERMFPNHGETYVLLEWCGDGYELYVCKTRDSKAQFRVVDKLNMETLVKERNRKALQSLIQCMLFKRDKRVGSMLFKQLSNLLRIQKTLFIYKDGSFSHSHK